MPRKSAGFTKSLARICWYGRLSDLPLWFLVQVCAAFTCALVAGGAQNKGVK